MITVEDCRRKATEGLGKAQVASDPKTIATLRRASNAWTALARHMEETTLRQYSLVPVRRPADLAKPPNSYSVDNVQIGDVLRERLSLSDDADVEWYKHQPQSATLAKIGDYDNSPWGSRVVRFAIDVA
jgi:hypothetical protein